MKKFIIHNKFLGTKIAIIFLVMSVLAGMNSRNDGDIWQSELYFLEAIVIAIGIGLYLIKKNRMLKIPKWNNNIYKYIEIFFLVSIVIFFILSILSGSWHEDPLIFSVTPVWIILAYIYLFFSRVDNDDLPIKK